MSEVFSDALAGWRRRLTAVRWLVSGLLCIFFLNGCGRQSAAKTDGSPRRPSTLVVPATGAYTGAFIAGDEATITEDDVQLENIEAFESDVGKHQAILAFSSYWGQQTFPTAAANVVIRHGSVPLIFWSPWDYPYLENKGPDRFRLDAILAGKWDAYIDQWADAARALGTPILVSFCNEMNGDWFPWSGTFYGAGDPVRGDGKSDAAPTPAATADSSANPAAAPPPQPPPAAAGPEFFKRTYRYVVNRVRARGARNVLWVFHVNNFSEPVAPWNRLANYYPGSDCIDWLGVSVYGQQFPSTDPRDWKDFEGLLRPAYDELAKLDPAKPIIVAEWGVGEFPKHGDRPGGGGDKAQWLNDAFNSMRLDCPRLRAAVYWHERWQNSGGGARGLYSNLRVTSSPAALAAYRRGVALPFWLSEPIFQ
ncbi:MAG: beta-mannanase [Verrucomicrobia bacterium]|nr:beta-mannanase [Verrucomicrobiota bacterium]